MMVQSSLCQSTARKLWLFLKASERLLIAQSAWLGPGRGKEKVMAVLPAANPVLLGFAAPSFPSLPLFWGTRPLGRWIWIPAKKSAAKWNS